MFLPLGQENNIDIRVRHPHKLRLSSIHMRELQWRKVTDAKEAHCLQHTIGIGVKIPVRDHDSIADFQSCDGGTELVDDAHGLVPECERMFHVDATVICVEISACHDLVVSQLLLENTEKEEYREGFESNLILWNLFALVIALKSPENVTYHRSRRW
jgi:hypothetical protein